MNNKYFEGKEDTIRKRAIRRVGYWKRQIRRSSEIAARRRIAANDQKKFTKNYIFETLKKYYIF